MHRWDRNKGSGKIKGGRLCLYIHNEWTNNRVITDIHCSPDLSTVFFSIKRAYCSDYNGCLYTIPYANTNNALALLLNAIDKQQSMHPDGVHITAGISTKQTKQNVKCPTRGENTLVYQH